MSLNNNRVNGCFDIEALALFVENKLGQDDMAEIAGHLMVCEKCAAEAKELAKMHLARLDAESGNVPEEVRQIVSNVMQDAKRKTTVDMWKPVFDAFTPQKEYLAAADGQSADQLQQQAAADAGFFYFYSNGKINDRSPGAWRVRMARPPSGGVSPEYILRLRVEEKSGAPIQSGLLTFCGEPLKICNGMAVMPLSKFLANIRKAMISLRRDGDSEDIPGQLVFR